MTLKAQSSEVYRDYLSRKGEDNDLYYGIKIDAAELLIANTQNTFVTPVFNGSASLREAAGQLIEETAKAVRRKKTVDDAFIDDTFAKVTSLKHLDQIGERAGDVAGAKKELGPLPSTSVFLLTALIAAWVIIAAFFLRDLVRKRKKNA